MKQRGYTDKELQEAISSGGTPCEKAMEFLYQKHLGPVVNFIVGRQGSHEVAKDIFQDALVSLLISVQQGKFEAKSSIGTYLFAISKNMWFRRLKRTGVEERYKSGLDTDEVELQGPEYWALEQEKKAQLEEMMAQLKDKCKAVLGLWAQKYSMKEIAAKLGYTSEQVARNKKNLCLKEFKELVRERPSVRELLRELV